MGKITDFKEFKANKGGEYSPLTVAEDLVGYIRNNPGWVTQIAVAIRTDDGQINTAYSTANHLSIMGLYEAGKLLTYEDME